MAGAAPLGAILIASLLAAQPAAAACTGAYGPNLGSGRLASSTAANGVKAIVDLEHDADVTGDRAILHPVQWFSNDPSYLGDFFAIGTYRGIGTDTGTSNCPTNYDAGWHVYVDGQYFAAWYFCRDQNITLGDSATGNEFKIRYGNTTSPCDSLSVCAYLNGDWLSKQYLDNATDGQVAAGGEVIPGSPVREYQNRVHYRNVMKHKSGVGWTHWGSGTTLCDDPYSVDVVQPYEFYPEKP